MFGKSWWINVERNNVKVNRSKFVVSNIFTQDQGAL